MNLLKNKNEIPAYSALSTGKIELLEDFKIQFEFSSASLVNELNLQKEDLMKFLHSKLNNYGIEFVIKITETEDNHTKSKDEVFKGTQKEKQIQKLPTGTSDTVKKDSVEKDISRVEQVETQKPADKKTIRPRVSKEVARNFNLKDIFKKTEEEIAEEPENYDDKPRTPFTEKELQKLWAEFLELLKDNHEIPAYNALLTGKIELLEDFKIQFEFSSASLVNELNLQKGNLMRFLHSKLNNYGIEFIMKITETRENYVKTKDEIFKEMAEKNPVLRKFKDEFGLDYDN